MIKNLRSKKKKGFSLVELIVVIAIIGILAAIAVPKYSAYKESANNKADLATAKLMAEATLMAMEDKAFTPATSAYDSSTKSADYNKIIAYLASAPAKKSKATGSLAPKIDIDITNKTIKAYVGTQHHDINY